MLTLVTAQFRLSFGVPIPLEETEIGWPAEGSGQGTSDEFRLIKAAFIPTLPVDRYGGDDHASRWPMGTSFSQFTTQWFGDLGNAGVFQLRDSSFDKRFVVIAHNKHPRQRGVILTLTAAAPVRAG